MKKTYTNEQLAMRVSVHTIIGNVALSAFKLFAGIVAHSTAMLSDAVHSLSDVMSTLIVMVGIKLSHKESDSNHQYGHERMECVASILLAVLLAITGAGIGYTGLQKVLQGNMAAVEVPGVLALVAAVVSIAVKEAMYWYTRKAAKHINSGALMADAWHHRSDALSSIGGFVGILGARLGLPVMDPLAAVVICLFIIKAAYDVFMDAVSKMTDEACDEETARALLALISGQPGVLGVDKMKTRLFGNKLYVDVEIKVQGALPLTQAHGIAQQVHDILEETFPQIKHCMVHVNPQEAHTDDI